MQSWRENMALASRPRIDGPRYQPCKVTQARQQNLKNNCEGVNSLLSEEKPEHICIVNNGYDFSNENTIKFRNKQSHIRVQNSFSISTITDIVNIISDTQFSFVTEVTIQHITLAPEDRHPKVKYKPGG